MGSRAVGQAVAVPMHDGVGEQPVHLGSRVVVREPDPQDALGLETQPLRHPDRVEVANHVAIPRIAERRRDGLLAGEGDRCRRRPFLSQPCAGCGASRTAHGSRNGRRRQRSPSPATRPRPSRRRSAIAGSPRGSATSTRSGVTERLGLEPEGVLRIGLTHYNTAAEVDRLLAELRSIIGTATA